MTTTSGSPLDLLRPDPPISQETSAAGNGAENNEEEDDELEALRQAALASMMKAKAPSHKIQKHPNRSNLLCIVVDDPDKQQNLKPKAKVRDLISAQEDASLRLQPQETSSPRRDKFRRFESGSESEEEEDEVEETFEEEEEVETETEVEVTDSEAEAAAKEEEKASGGQDKDTSVNVDDDILNVDCRDEEDEFSKFLNEFESELNEPNLALKKSTAKGKKTKLVKQKKLVKKMVKKTRMVKVKHKSTAATKQDKPDSLSRSFSRSPISPYRMSIPPPHFRRHSRSPSPYRRRYSPPYLSGGRRPYSPPSSRYGGPNYRRSPPPPTYRRSRSPPPPMALPHRRIRSPNWSSDHSVKFSQRRGDSAPRSVGNQDKPEAGSKPFPPRRERQDKPDDDHVTKSKSLPPKNEEQNDEGKRRIEAEKEEQKRLEFEERLRRLPTPDRERVLARRRKFESSQSVKPEKRVISLKSAVAEAETETSKDVKRVRRLTSEDTGDAISLSVDDTLDMFEESERGQKRGRQPPSSLAARLGVKRDASDSTGSVAKPVIDLRQQLHRKRQSRPEEPLPYSDEEIYEEEDDDDEHGGSVMSGNRIVKAPSRERASRLSSPLKRGSRSPDLRTTKLAGSTKSILSPKSSTLKPSIMSRLGEQVIDGGQIHSDEEEETDVKVKRKRKKTSVSDSADEATMKLIKKEKKKEKKEKKKEKKEKKKKEKRKKRKSKVSSDSDEEVQESAAPKASAAAASLIKDGSSSDEELWGFFENMDKDDKTSGSERTATSAVGAAKTTSSGSTKLKADILLDQMRKKNQDRLKRMKEIEEDKLLHQ